MPLKFIITALSATFLNLSYTHNGWASDSSADSSKPVADCLISHASISVRDFGAKGDGLADDTSALQKALDSATPGSIIVIPRGQYIISASLLMKQPNIVLAGNNASFIATTPADQTLKITGDHSAVVGIHFKGVGTARLENDASTKIDVEGNYIQLIGNSINGGASGGIFINGAHGFLIQNNAVANTLADGIHMTRGAANGIVTGNTVQNTGDDMIAVVSYRKHARPPDTDILIAHNNVSGNPWGRGISVVGGENITIDSNHITDVSSAAGIYIAQEDSYQTMDVTNVLVENNTLSNIEEPFWKKPSAHHAALDIDTGKGTVQYVAFRNNTVTNAYYGGIRFRGNTCHDGAYNNHFADISTLIPWSGVLWVSENNCAPEGNTCTDNKTIDGSAVTSPSCTGKIEPAVTGSHHLSYAQGTPRTGSWGGCLDY